jgi:hypothetical protein
MAADGKRAAAEIHAADTDLRANLPLLKLST